MTALGKCFLTIDTVDHSQVHAHDPHLLFARKPQEIGLQGRFGTAEYDIVDAMILQVAHGGGVAFAAGEEMLVDAQSRIPRRKPQSSCRRFASSR